MMKQERLYQHHEAQDVHWQESGKISLVNSKSTSYEVLLYCWRSTLGKVI